MMEETQATRRGTGPLVYVGPDREHFGPEHASSFVKAVEEGGGRAVEEAEEAEAIVWLGSEISRLPDLLHPGMRWVQLPSAGVEPWTENGLLDTERVYTSAASAYAYTVAEHALALMLTGARRLHESARATRWEARWGRLFAGSTVVILGAGGIGRALIRLLEPFGVEVLAVTHSGRRVPGATENYSADQTDELWPEGDFFVAPATGATKHMI